eukprot:IDg8014t1
MLRLRTRKLSLLFSALRKTFAERTADWTPRHVCVPGAIRSHVRNRMRQGQSHVHTVTDLLLGIEEDAKVRYEEAYPTMEGEPSASATNFAENSLLELDNALDDAGAPDLLSKSSADVVDAHIIDSTI